MNKRQTIEKFLQIRFFHCNKSTNKVNLHFLLWNHKYHQFLIWKSTMCFAVTLSVKYQDEYFLSLSHILLFCWNSSLFSIFLIAFPPFQHHSISSVWWSSSLLRSFLHISFWIAKKKLFDIYEKTKTPHITINEKLLALSEVLYINIKSS